jgi:hypothetical protein
MYDVMKRVSVDFELSAAQPLFGKALSFQRPLCNSAQVKATREPPG